MIYIYFFLQKEGKAQERRNYEIKQTFVGMQAPKISSNMSF